MLISDTQQRAGLDVAEPAVFDEELDGGSRTWASLYLIEENEGAARGKRGAGEKPLIL